MFPRVIGRLAGQIASATCEGFNYIHRQAERIFSPSAIRSAEVGFQRGVAEATVLLLLPNAARPLVTAYRAWNFYESLMNRNQSSGVSKLGSSSQKAGLACYFNALTESDPLLLSPVGTMPFQRCFR